MKGKRYFQWIDGEDFGNVEVLDSIRYEKGEYFFDFVSGESMNMRYIAAQTNDVNAIKGKALVEIQDPYDKWTAKEIKSRIEVANSPDQGEITVEIPSIEDYVAADAGGNIEKSSVGTKRFTAPRFKGPFKPLPDPIDYMEKEKEIIAPKEIEDVKKVENQTISSFIKSPVMPLENTPVVGDPAPKIEIKPRMASTDPVYILISSSNKEEKSVDLTLKLNLPSKDLYKIVKSQFDNGKNKFIDCITDILSESLTSKEVLESLKDSIIQAYEAE